MKDIFNFTIAPTGIVSGLFLAEQISDFNTAINFVKQIPYGRNNNKHDIACVFKDLKGTCSTKHALLKTLAMENGQDAVKLILCLFKMNSKNTPAINEILSQHNLEYIPEAHNYLHVCGKIIDCTFPGSSNHSFINDIISETDIQPEQVTSYKVNFHKAFLQKWLNEQDDLSISFETLWQIREACIAKLSSR